MFRFSLSRFLRSLFLGPAADPSPLAPPPAQPALDSGERIYAIGDIHGRLDLLSHLLDLIEKDIDKTAPALTRLVFLGDYIDRGTDPKGVIDRLLQPLPGNLPPVFLLGNHEQVLLSLFETMHSGAGWLMYGGLSTLFSYGIPCPPGVPNAEKLAILQQNLRDRFPEEHRAFLASLPLSYAQGDYFFAHAGVRPQNPLDQQDPMDLLWIRRGFLDSPQPLEKIIVHGHTITPDVEIRPNRIGIDTGAYASGRLTALVLEGTTRRFLQTGSATEDDAVIW